MRLTVDQHRAVLDSVSIVNGYPDATVTQLPGGGRVAVWQDPDYPLAVRWRAKLLATVDTEMRVWWYAEHGARTRRGAIEAAATDTMERS